MLIRWPERETEIFKKVTERDVAFLLCGFQGLPLPGSSVAGQGLCDDDD